MTCRAATVPKKYIQEEINLILPETNELVARQRIRAPYKRIILKSKNKKRCV